MMRPEMKKPGFWRTLRFRFALWTAGLLFAVLAAFGAFVYFSMARGLSASIDDSLSLNASQVIAAVEVEHGKIDLPDNFEEGPDSADLRERGLTLRLLTPDGQVLGTLGSSRALPIVPESLAAAREQRTTFTTVSDPLTEGEVRVHTAPITDDNEVIGVVQVAQTLAGVEETLNRLLTALLVGVPLLAIVAGLGGYLLAARALAPIDRITRTARRISAEDLSARLNLPATEDEVGRLAATFDEMLAHLDESFRRERQFTADASHELRTPLAAMQVILGTVLQRRRAPAEYEQALADLAEEIDRLQTLTEALLLLARGEARQLASRERVDFSTLLCDVTDSMRPLAKAKGLTVTCVVGDGLALMGDTDGLIRLFANLLDNAVRYTEHGGVTVRAGASSDGTISVTVADTGRGIPAELLPRVFDRFYRVDKSRTERGAGLGLAIALDIAHAHDGTIEVSSIVGKGTTFTVQLPSAR